MKKQLAGLAIGLFIIGCGAKPAPAPPPGPAPPPDWARGRQGRQRYFLLSFQTRQRTLSSDAEEHADLLFAVGSQGPGLYGAKLHSFLLETHPSNAL